MLHKLRCKTCTKYKWGDCIALAKDTSLIDIVGCASHSDFNKPKKAHDVEKFYEEERIPKYKDTIFEETEDGGAVIGYLTESPSGCPRPNMAKLTKRQYADYKKNNVNYGD
jgi:hypothetical protein